MELCKKLIKHVLKETPLQFIHYSEKAIIEATRGKNWKLVQLISKYCEDFSENKFIEIDANEKPVEVKDHSDQELAEIEAQAEDEEYQPASKKGKV